MIELFELLYEKSEYIDIVSPPGFECRNRIYNNFSLYTGLMKIYFSHTDEIPLDNIYNFFRIINSISQTIRLFDDVNITYIKINNFKKVS